MKYTIRKGHHYCFTINRLWPFTKTKLKGNVIFDHNCLVKGDKPGHNKLTGITSFKIHKNSGRLVWESNGKSIDLYGYVYDNGSRTEIYITSLLLNTWFGYSIEHRGGNWYFTVNGKTVVIHGNIGFWKFKCFPYFGGVSTAPKTMTIKLKML